MALDQIKGIGKKKKVLLEELGIMTVEDLLFFFPRSYENRTEKITFEEGSTGTFIGTVVGKEMTGGYSKKHLLRIQMTVDGQIVTLLFFQSPYLEKAFRFQEDYVVYGTLQRRGFFFQMIHPSFAPAAQAEQFQQILPLYRYKKGLRSNDWRHFLRQALEMTPHDFLVDEDREKWNLLSLKEALKEIHFPSGREDFARAKYRIIFDEFFRFLLVGKMREKRRVPKISVSNDSIDRFSERLPYVLTASQRQAMEEIRHDLLKGVAMRRLLQGDVGSGKSTVAFYPMALLSEKGHQSAYMTPTEILARQQYESFTALFPAIKTVFLSASTKDKESIRKELREGHWQVIVGTHALLHEEVEFQDLRLIVTDEQHRFGVAQREQLHRKGRHAHLLQMSATPIPRTLSLLLFGDLDQSVLDEKPPGRHPIATQLITPSQLANVYSFIKKGFSEGEKAYIVFPAIEESENASMASLESAEEELKAVFGDEVSFLHGRMSAREKERILQQFYEGKTHVLASTTLIEVGMDVPEATRLLLRSAHLFGLSQIHQIRGRIGRNRKPATCYLCAEGTHVPERLEILTREKDGFVIAEEDLRLRGPGEIRGLRQHGELDFQLADIIRHEAILRRVHTLLDEPTLQFYQDKWREQNR